MSWLFFAILAPAIYAVVVFVDKYLLEKEIKDYRGMPIYTSIMAAFFGTLIWIVNGFPILNFKDSLLIILTGMLTVWGSALYFKAISNHEVTKVTFLLQMTPVITLILSFWFLGSGISLQQMWGFLLILTSTIAISTRGKLQKLNLSNVFFLILLADFFWSSAFVIFKFVVDGSSFSKVISYEGWGIGFGGLILYNFFPSFRKAFHKINKTVSKKIISVIAINEGIYLVAKLMTYLAISKGSVALVDVVSGTQVLFAIVYGWILTLLAPKIFKENITKESLFKKTALAGIVLFGLWLVR